MRKQILFIASVLLLLSCTSNDKPVVIRKESCKAKTTFDCSSVEADRMLSMEIKGMSCVMGCGASIRKELLSTKAVCSVEFDFKDNREYNTAKIAFDKDKITTDELIKLISNIDDKKFTVGKTSSKEYSCPTAQSGTCPSNNTDCHSACKSDSKIKSSESKIEIPNFLNIISRFFTS